MTVTFTSSAALTTEWLSGALGTNVTGFEIEPIGVGVGLVCDLVRIRLDHDGDGPATVVAKFPSPSEENAFVALVLNMYGRETHFYTSVDALAQRLPPRQHVLLRRSRPAVRARRLAALRPVARPARPLLPPEPEHGAGVASKPGRTTGSRPSSISCTR